MYGQQPGMNMYGQMGGYAQPGMYNAGYNNNIGYVNNGQMGGYVQPSGSGLYNNGRIDFTGVIIDNYEEVKNYPVVMNGITLLLNRKDKRFYLKQLNENGVPIVETYVFDSLNVEQEQNDVKQSVLDVEQLNKRLDAIEKKLDAPINF
jgi:hypothetical protein